MNCFVHDTVADLSSSCPAEQTPSSVHAAEVGRDEGLLFFQCPVCECVNATCSATVEFPSQCNHHHHYDLWGFFFTTRIHVKSQICGCLSFKGIPAAQRISPDVTPRRSSKQPEHVLVIHHFSSPAGPSWGLSLASRCSDACHAGVGGKRLEEKERDNPHGQGSSHTVIETGARYAI